MFARNIPDMGVAAFICLLIGCGFTLHGVSELHEVLHSTAGPVEITCSQLRTYRGSNKRITLTQFVPYPEGTLIVKNKRFREWSVWIPVLPTDAPAADPKYIVAAVAVSGVSDEASLRRALAKPRWTGVINARGDMGIYSASFCRFNPGINFGSCWVIWERGTLPAPFVAIFKLIVCPPLFALGIVLAVVAVLRSIRALSEASEPSPGFLFNAVSTLDHAVHRLYRRGFLSGSVAVLLAAVGLAAVGGAAYFLNRDWDNVARVTNEMYYTIVGGLIGLGLFACAVLLVVASWRTAPAAPTPALSRLQLAHVDKPPADVKQKAVGVMAFGFVLFFAAGVAYYRSDNPRGAMIAVALGSLALVAGAVWYGFLRTRGRQEQAQFWN